MVFRVLNIHKKCLKNIESKSGRDNCAGFYGRNAVERNEIVKRLTKLSRKKSYIKVSVCRALEIHVTSTRYTNKRFMFLSVAHV